MIYNAPKEIKVPKYSNGPKDDERIRTEVREWCKKHSKSKHAGEIISFPVADGRAEYMVFKLRPLAIIHLPVNDRYQSPTINYMDAKDIVRKIEFTKKVKALLENK